MKPLAILKSLITTAIFALFAGCGGTSDLQTAAPSDGLSTGKITASIAWNSVSKTVESAPAGVTTMRFIVSGSGISPALQKDFAASAGVGIIDGVPAGTARTLTVQGINSSGTITHQGAAANITVQAGQTSDAGTITMVANSAPVANAGSAQSVTVGSLVSLDGSASSDANSDALSFKWAFTSKPGGSSAALSSATAVKPTFTPDVVGSYAVSLTVNDGKVDSTAASVTITASAANVAPVANAGTAQSVVVGSAVTLDGSASSDANGDTLTYSWSITTRPAGSSAALSSATAASPTFTPDVVGSYTASLTVNDGKLGSTAATVSITAIANNGSITVRW